MDTDGIEIKANRKAGKRTVKSPGRRTGNETGLAGIENGLPTGLKRDLLELEIVKRYLLDLMWKEIRNGEPGAEQD